MKRFVTLTLVGCAFMAFQNAATTQSIRRDLKCKTVGGEAADTKRELSLFEGFIDRLLAAEGVEDPCQTDYPPNALDEITYDALSPQANQEPKFEVVSNGPPWPEVDASGAYAIEPPRTDGLDEPPLENTQRELLDTYDPDFYDPQERILSKSDNDADTVAYVVALDACQSWYQDAGDTAPDAGSDLYESAAILKSQACEHTETTIARSLQGNGVVDDKRKLAAQMNFTM